MVALSLDGGAVTHNPCVSWAFLFVNVICITTYKFVWLCKYQSQAVA